MSFSVALVWSILSVLKLGLGAVILGTRVKGARLISMASSVLSWYSREALANRHNRARLAVLLGLDCSVTGAGCSDDPKTMSRLQFGTFVMLNLSTAAMISENRP